MSKLCDFTIGKKIGSSSKEHNCLQDLYALTRKRQLGADEASWRENLSVEMDTGNGFENTISDFDPTPLEHSTIQFMETVWGLPVETIKHQEGKIL